MRIKLLFKIYFLAILISTNVFCQSIVNAPQSSFMTYAFRLTESESFRIVQKGNTVIDSTYFHSPIDSTYSESRTFEEKKLPNGNYLIAYIEENQLNFSFLRIAPFQVKILNNLADFRVLVHDPFGNIIRDAKFFLGKKKVPYNEKLGVFQIKKRQNGGILRVEYSGIYFENIKANYLSKGKKISYRFFYGMPLGYIFRPIRDIALSIKKGYAQGFVYKVKSFFQSPINYIENKRDRRYYKIEKNNFIVFNKPKYLPKDTVRFKVAILNKKGRFIDKGKQFMFLDSYEAKILNLKLVEIKPYDKGRYEGSFVLSDSLKLPLGFNYKLTFGDDDYASGNFKYEQYNLESETYSITASKENFYGNEPIELKLTGMDENNLPIVGTKVKVEISTKSIGEVADSLVFVPNKLLETDLIIGESDPTKIILPDSIFPKATINCKVKATFINLQNEVQQKEIQFTKNLFQKNLKISLKNDSIYCESPSGRFQKAELVFKNKDAIAIGYKNINLPHYEPINPFLKEVILRKDSLDFVNFQIDDIDKLDIIGNRSKDSIWVNLENPIHIKYW